jgi:hypothetical protein
MRRKSACVSVALAALGIAGLHGCSLINLDALDPAVPEASASGASDAPVGTTVTNEDANMAPDDSPTGAGDDVVASGDDASDATQGGDVSDLASSGEAGNASASSGTASGSSSGAASGSASGAARGSGSTSGSGTTGSSMEAGDDHTCGSAVLTPNTAVASSFQPASPGNVALPAGLAIDNNFSTRWGSVFQTDPSWLYVDYGAPVFVDEVDILWQTCGANYDIDVSTDATHWTTIKTVVGNTTAVAIPSTNGWSAPAVLRYTGLSGRGRYVRINGTARCSAMYGYSIWEVRALGDTDGNCTL